ncbi:formate dehydrogenase beta subunit [Mangrovimicrobium sediminis]|uniref:NADH-quinone oxidoreductase subunit F n=1 Tax=Mangrovimicrobium sediminis TaxID=2562682 RepID=A0A4Z0M9H2_9GAMM|nr:formate dehydrogenase beta subunit [Haliea sp. SAOS-164]TGD76038.1 formate dehydrogenase beta subunit [Haliea sp. SAOS-164]
MSVRYFVPADTTAIAVGADDVAQALAAALETRGEYGRIVRNGSRGAFWLEPLLEIEQHGRRVGFGPLSAAEVDAIVALPPEAREQHPLFLGDVEALPWFAAQRRLTFARAGLGDPLSLDDYLLRRGFDALERALEMAPEEIVQAIDDSGLRGRGGAAFPAGIKWRTVMDTPAGQKYIVCNADEGDSGTFADRLLLEADPYQLLEGMAIAGLAVGADTGYIYLRSEYPRAREVLRVALAKAEAAGYLGSNLAGSQRSFRIHLRIGAGAYICGEETALLESLEGRRGMVRAKPPLPAHQGLFGRPTLVHNVLTLAAATTVIADGAQAYAALGEGRSRGTLSVQLAGNVRRGGLVEVPFGVTLRQLLEDFGGGTRSGRPLRAVQAGGPLGAYLPESLWDTPLDYEALAAVGGMLGHGGLVLFDDSVDMARQARFAMAFCTEESCGKCTPCRIGAVRGTELLDRVIAREAPHSELALLEELCDTMEQASLCAMGGMTPAPVRSALAHFPEDFA